MKKFLLITAAAAAIILGTSVSASAQKNSDNTYNLQRAYEVLQKDYDEDQALKLLKDQIKLTPDNAEAYLLRVRIYMRQENYGNALSDINTALKVNKPKKSGIQNSTLHWWKATVYNEMGDLESAATSYKKSLELAKKDSKENVQPISFEYAQCLYGLNLYAESDKIYNDMVKADETDQAAMVGLARNMIAREEYAAAIACLKKTITYGKDYAEPYKFLAQAYDKMGETDKAIDNILTYYDKDDDARIGECTSMIVRHSTYAEAKIKEYRNDSDKKGAWDFLMISLYTKTGKKEQAITIYDQLEVTYGQDALLFYNRAELYSDLGMSEKAVEQYTLAMEKDSDYSLQCNAGIGTVYRHDARYDLARIAFEKVIDEMPSNAYGYYTTGWCYEMEGNDEKAMEYYDKGIDLDKDYPYIFLMRGELYSKMGKEDLARTDYESVLQKDTTADNGSCRMYALHFLGKDEEAEAWMEKIIEGDPLEAGNYYDKACLMSRMGKLSESVEALRKAFELGYTAIGHVEHDDDLDAVREREDFKELVSTYREIIAERISEFQKGSDESKEKTISEIAITRKSGGIFEVPCSVNGLPLNMIFDTGASDVTISSVEANFMFKNGYIEKDDIKGKKYYQIANGEISEGTVIVLHDVTVGDAVLKNVEASVVKSQKAPLLLGESVLKKFGTITIDNINSKLIIKQ